MNTQTATPKQIDAAIYAILVRASQAHAAAAGAVKGAASYRKGLAQDIERFGSPTYYSVAKADELDRAAVTALDIATAVSAETAPYDAEFAARGGWTRFFLVRNSNGHVHSSRSCSTCFIDTDFAWLPEYSDEDEAGVVELAGESACTVCFPSAPVDVLNRKSQIELPERKAAREERAAAAAARAAKKAAKAIPETTFTCQGSFKETVETIAAARSRLTDHYHYTEVYGWKEFITAGLDTLVAAIAAKEGKTTDEVIAEARKRAAKRK